MKLENYIEYKVWQISDKEFEDFIFQQGFRIFIPFHKHGMADLTLIEVADDIGFFNQEFSIDLISKYLKIIDRKLILDTNKIIVLYSDNLPVYQMPIPKTLYEFILVCQLCDIELEWRIDG